jgi:hypothetical protein
MGGREESGRGDGLGENAPRRRGGWATYIRRRSPPLRPLLKDSPSLAATQYLQQPPGLPYLRPPLLVVISCEVVRTSV